MIQQRQREIRRHVAGSKMSRSRALPHAFKRKDQKGRGPGMLHHVAEGFRRLVHRVIEPRKGATVQHGNRKGYNYEELSDFHLRTMQYKASGAGEALLPGTRPERLTLRGRFVTITPLRREVHAQSLYQHTCGPENDGLWTYMGAGPFADFRAFEAHLENKAASE